MLKHIKASNFKSWQKMDLRLAPVTGLFGTNSSGKTSILQLLLLLKQTKETTDRSLAVDFGSPQRTSYVNLGTYRDVIFDHDTESLLSWRIEWELPENIKITDQSISPARLLFEGNQLVVGANISFKRNQPSTDRLFYELGGQQFSLTRKEGRPSAFSMDSTGPDKTFRFIRTHGRVWDIPGPVKSYIFPEKAKTYFQNADFLGELELSYENLVDNIYYLGPLREFPRRDYIWSGASPLDVGQQGEQVVEAILSARARHERRNLKPKAKLMEFETIIAYWLKKLGLIDSFEVKEIGRNSNLYRVEVKKSPKGPSVLITDVGFGVSQILPVLVLLYYVPEGSVVLLEQPEIHLHPSVQSGLADVILSVAKHRKVQVVVESHSEHLLRRFQLRVAENNNNVLPDDLALYFCEIKGMSSRATVLDIDLYGSIHNWPDGFFGDEFGELAARKEAGLRKRLSNT